MQKLQASKYPDDKLVWSVRFMIVSGIWIWINSSNFSWPHPTKNLPYWALLTNFPLLLSRYISNYVRLLIINHNFNGSLNACCLKRAFSAFQSVSENIYVFNFDTFTTKLYFCFPCTCCVKYGCSYTVAGGNIIFA